MARPQSKGMSTYIELPRPSLPEDYYLDTSQDITTRELVELLYAGTTDWVMLDYLAQAYEHQAQLYEEVGVSTLKFGVRNREDELVGTGFLLHDGAIGELSCLAVRSSDRSRGIGKVIIAERIRSAHGLGLGSLCVKRLSGANTLGSYYAQLGFVVTEAGTLSLGERTVPFSLSKLRRAKGLQL